MTGEASFDLSFDGLVAAHAEPDDGMYDDDRDYETGDTWAIDTLRVDGADVLTAVADAADSLRGPIRATVTVDGTQVATGPLWVSRGYAEAGCGDGCCGGYNAWEFKVGGRYGYTNTGVDVLAHLEGLHAGYHQVRIQGQGYVPPLVDVTLAHHTHHGPLQGRPGDRLTLPLDQLLGVRARLTAASWDRVMEAQRKVADEHADLR